MDPGSSEVAWTQVSLEGNPMRSSFSSLLFLIAVCVFTTSKAAGLQVDEEGTVHLPAYTLPESSLLGADALDVLKDKRARGKEEALYWPWPVNAPETCSPEKGADATHMQAIRTCETEAFYKTPAYQHLREIYHVAMTSTQIGGVDTEVFVPSDGIPAKNANRVLINVHGGGFLAGARTLSHLESVPIASVGKIKVVSVDYRLAPEYVFPAASQDVASVYRELLKSYKPGDIGIYGCSAGGLLTAEAVAWFQKEHLPRPGAVGMFCGGADYFMDGDSGYIFGAPLTGGSIQTASQNPYFKGANINDPLVLPARSLQVMAKFPPSLLITGTRDHALSSVVHSHSLLVAQGVESELHVWEGVGHAFFYDPDLPQSREVYTVTVRFFDTHLGR